MRSADKATYAFFGFVAFCVLMGIGATAFVGWLAYTLVMWIVSH